MAVTFEACFFGYAPGTSLSAPPGTAVYNSNISNAGVWGIEIHAPATTQGPRLTTFQNNSINNSGANGMFIGGAYGTQILSNTLVNNHSTCPFGAPGGQISLTNTST